MKMKLTGKQKKDLRNRIQKRLQQCMLKVYDCPEDDVASWWWTSERVQEEWSCYANNPKFAMSVEEVMDELMSEIELD